MKIFSNLWKPGVALLLCFSLFSVSALACDTHADAEEFPEETFESAKLPEAEHEEAEFLDGDDGAEHLSSYENVLSDLPETGVVPAADVREAAVPEEEVKMVDAVEEQAAADETTPDGITDDVTTDEETTEENTEPAIGTVVKSGDCGYVIGTMFYTVTYVGDGHYKLTISGTGKMLMIAVKYGAPWHNYSAGIVEIEIQDGVEGIREYAFNDCDLVTTLTIPASVNYIENGSFNMKGLKSVYFLGSYYDKFKPNAFSGTTDVTVYHRNDLNWGDFTFNGTTTEASDLTLQKIDAIDPDCTTEGNLEYYYSETWDKYFADPEAKQEIVNSQDLMIPALGHEWDEGVVTQEPTATEEGVMTYTCIRCADTRTDVIAATGGEVTPEEPAAPDDDEQIPDDDTQTPDEDVQLPDEGVQLPDDDFQTSEDDIRIPVDVNVNVNYQNRPGAAQTAGQPVQTEAVSAGQVKTADENPYVLYLVLLALSGFVLVWVIRKRIAE